VMTTIDGQEVSNSSYDATYAQQRSGYLLLGCSVISVTFNICILTLLLMLLAGLHFCVGLNFVTSSHCNLF
jgi:hypothetical protein